MTTTEYARPDWQRRMSPRFKALAARDGLLCAYCAVPLVDPLNDEHWLWDGGGNYINCPDRVHDDGGCTHPEGCWFPLREMRPGIVEHVVPRAKGGGNHLDNLVLSCPGCNDQKGAKLLTDLPRGWWLAGLSRRARQWRDDEIDEQHERINVVWERARNHHVGQTRVVVANLELVAPIATRPTQVPIETIIDDLVAVWHNTAEVNTAVGLFEFLQLHEDEETPWARDGVCPLRLDPYWRWLHLQTGAGRCGMDA